MSEKSRDAFRTISEVADWLDVPTHVLRFWESRFSQIKPVKRAGGRRYYRPSDMRVIGGVKVLLHDQGMTIRGVQKLFREEGIKHVSGYSPALYGEEVEDETPAVLNEEALELAARPAGAARSTRGAEPAPEPEDVPFEDDAPPLFRRTVSQRITPVAQTPAEPEPPAPSIPATPDVPAEDAADDAPGHVQPASIAARLKTIPVADLLKHHELLAPAAERLRSLASQFA